MNNSDESCRENADACRQSLSAAHPDELFEIRIRKSGRPSQARPQRDRVLATPDNPSRGGSFARHARGFL